VVTVWEIGFRAWTVPQADVLSSFSHRKHAQKSSGNSRLVVSAIPRNV
jgi:hypothetical protein